jgi:hypothetical protein
VPVSDRDSPLITAADGWYPARAGRAARETAPVLIDASVPFPGVILPPWPPAVPGQPFEPPVGRGIPRLAGKNGSGRGPSCQHTMLVRQNGRLVSHKTCGQHCTGSGEKPADPNLAGGAAADSLNGRVRGCLLPGEEYADDAQTAVGGEASAVHG